MIGDRHVWHDAIGMAQLGADFRSGALLSEHRFSFV
jgi:hypothetical protein